MNDWHKSSYSYDIGTCLEVRDYHEGTDVRDTENRDAGHLTFGTTEWSALRAAL